MLGICIRHESSSTKSSHNTLFEPEPMLNLVVCNTFLVSQHQDLFYHDDVQKLSSAAI